MLVVCYVVDLFKDMKEHEGKVLFIRKACGLRPKSHIILIEVKKEARYLKMNNKTHTTRKKTAKIFIDLRCMVLG